VLSGDRLLENELVKRKRTERFCVLGLSSCLNTELLKSVIEEKGPCVRGMRIFKLRRNPEKVLLKLTLIANDKARLVLSDDFWPHYVRCEPWLA
jgi:hypothetical protein